MGDDIVDHDNELILTRTTNDTTEILSYVRSYIGYFIVLPPPFQHPL